MTTPPNESILRIRRGTTEAIAWPVTSPDSGLPMDLSGWSGEGQIRAGYGAATVLFSWPEDAAIECTAGGDVVVHISAAQSSGWTWDRAVYGIEITSPTGDVITLAQGLVLVTPEVVF